MINIKLFETYKSQKELEKLTTDILRIVGDKTYKDALKYQEYKKKQGVDTISPILDFTTVYFDDDFDEKTELLNKYDKKGKYNELYEFIVSNIVTILFKEVDKKREDGSYDYTIFGREIYLYYTTEFKNKINIKFKNGEIKNGNGIYFMIHRSFYTALLHELQHAYDGWRSKEKAIKRTDIFDIETTRSRNIIKRKNDNKLTDSELKFIRKHHKEYLNLKHEVDARFTQTLQKVRPIKMNWDKKENEVYEWYLQDWEKFYKEFKYDMVGWKDLSDKDKRRLVRRLSQFYEFEKDEIIKKNNELREKRKTDK